MVPSVRRSTAFRSWWSAGEAQQALADDVAQDLRGATHDGVAGGVTDVAGACVPRSSHSGPATEPQNSATRCSNSVHHVLVTAEKPGGAWPSTSRSTSDAADPVAALEPGELLARRVGSVDRDRAPSTASRYRRRFETSRSMPPRSCSICRMICLNAPLRLPTSIEPSTSTSSKITSQKWRSSVMSRIGRTSTPGDCRSTMNSDSPACGAASGSVRAIR